MKTATAPQLVDHPPQIAEFNAFEAKLSELRKKYKTIVYDLADPKQEKQARADRLLIGRVISALDRRHREIKAPLKERTDLIDRERKRIKDELLEVQGAIKSQIKARDDELARIAAEIQEQISVIENLPFFESGWVVRAEDISERLEEAMNLVIDEVYGDRMPDAALAKEQAVRLLEEALAKQTAHEAEQAELARLREESENREREAREERIRQEAAAQAEKKAERRERIAAESAREKIKDAKRRESEAKERVERQKQEAIEAENRRQEELERIRKQAKIDAKRIKKEVEAKGRAKAEAAAKKESARKAKKAHRSKIQKEAIFSMGRFFGKAVKFDNADDQAASLVEAIDAGEVAHIQIIY